MTEAPPAEIGSYLLATGVFVFKHIFSGVTYTCAVRSGDRGWVLVSHGTVDTTVITAALIDAAALGLEEVFLAGAHYTPVDPIVFPANQLALVGVGRATFLDGVGLANNEHLIVISGRTDCIVKDMSMQTDQGSGKTSHCIFIEDGSNSFRIESVLVLKSAASGVHIEGTNIVDGWILFCWFDLTDADSIYSSMDALNYLSNVEIEGCTFQSLVQLYSIALYDGQFCLVIHNKVYRSHGGILVRDSSYVTIENNICQGTFGDEIDVHTCLYCCIENNIIHNGAGIGICLTTCSYCGVTGNQIYSTIADGIQLDTGSTYNWVNDNIVYNAGEFGIYIAAAVEVGNIIGKNILRVCASGPISDNGTDTVLPEITVYVSDPNGVIGAHPAVVLTDGVDVLHRFEVQVPTDFQGCVRARVILVAGAAGNLRREVATNFGKICAAEDYNTHVGAIAASEVAVLINDLTCIDVTASLANLAAGDLVGLVFTRDGSHANDTVGADCYLLELNIQYV